MRQSIEYSMTANRAILDYASRYREKVLYNIYRMGRDEIKWGSEDHWTFTPHEMARVQEGLVAKGAITPSEIPGAASTATATAAAGVAVAVAAGAAAAAATARSTPALTAPELRDPRGFILPADQPDFGTATKFVNTLMKTGITIQRATRAVHRRRQELSGELVRREDRAGVPAARAWTCSSRRIIPTTSRIRAARRRRRTTRPATRSRSRWACSSIASSTTSTARSRS